jgi:hypothetical protein
MLEIELKLYGPDNRIEDAEMLLYQPKTQHQQILRPRNPVFANYPHPAVCKTTFVPEGLPLGWRYGATYSADRR